jgi:hypothetical protein
VAYCYTQDIWQVVDTDFTARKSSLATGDSQTKHVHQLCLMLMANIIRFHHVEKLLIRFSHEHRSYQKTLSRIANTYYRCQFWNPADCTRTWFDHVKTKWSRTQQDSPTDMRNKVHVFHLRKYVQVIQPGVVFRWRAQVLAKAITTPTALLCVWSRGPIDVDAIR